MLHSGQLRHIVTIQRNQGEDNGLGSAEAWTDFATDIRAGIEPLSGREYFAAGQMQTKVTHKIKVRYLAGVEEAMRVVWGARVFDIKSVIDPDERHRELHIMAEETTEDA